AKTERCLYRIGQSSRDAGLYHQPIDHSIDAVFPLLVQPDLVCDRNHDAIHPQARETRLADLIEHLAMLPFALLYQRCEQHKLGTVRQLLNLTHDLLRSLLRHCPAAAVAGEPTDASPEHAQIIVDLRDGAYR